MARMLVRDCQLACGCAFKDGELVAVCYNNLNHSKEYWELEVGRKILVTVDHIGPVQCTSCPSCIKHVIHSKEDWNAFHTLAGHGYTPEQGWTSPEAKAAHERDVQATIAREAKIKREKAGLT